jgi:protein SCO1/2
VLLLAFGGVVLAACGGAVVGAPPPSQGIVQDRVVPNVALINEQGQATSLAAYRGKYIVLANFLSLCQDECPLITGAFLALQQDLKEAGLAHEVVFMEISVDPGRDTPARLAAYSQRFGADWPILTGTPANLARLWSFFGVTYFKVPEEQPPIDDWWTGQPLTYDVDHTDGYILIDRTGRERFIDANPPNLHGKLEPGLKKLLNDGGVQGLEHSTGPHWTLGDLASAISWLIGAPVPNSAST